MRIVLVRWIDSCASGGQWEDKCLAQDMKPNNCESLGFVYADNDECIVLVQSQGGVGENRSAVLNSLVIPKSSIKEIKELSVNLQNME